MSIKNTLENKKARKEAKSYDREYLEFYSKVTNAKGYSKLVGPQDKPKVDIMKKVFSKVYMEGFFAMLGIPLVEAEVAA